MAIAVFGMLLTPVISMAQQTMADDHNILTVKEIYEILRIHPSTVYKLIRQGKIPGFRIGREWRFRKDVIMRWMDQRSGESK
jgi:excisionase family DNA binding protein